MSTVLEQLQKCPRCLALSSFPGFLAPHTQHVEVPRLEVQLELQLLDYATATAMPDPSCIRDLHHSSRQHQILNPLSEARDRTQNFMVPCQVCFCCATTETPYFVF